MREGAARDATTRPKPDPDRSTSRRVFRSRMQSLLIGALGVVFPVGGIVQAWSFADGGELGTGATVAITAAWVAFFAYALGRLARCAAIATGDSLIVMNPIRTTAYRWPEIADFTIGPSGVYPAIGQIVLENGHRARIWGIQARNPLVWRQDPAAQALIEGLREELRSRRG